MLCVGVLPFAIPCDECQNEAEVDVITMIITFVNYVHWIYIILYDFYAEKIFFFFFLSSRCVVKPVTI